jgi:hypothetical protein
LTPSLAVRKAEWVQSVNAKRLVVSARASGGFVVTLSPVLLSGGAELGVGCTVGALTVGRKVTNSRMT